jgi:hypothetical protein
MRSSALLGFTDGDVWHPGIGDPTFMGWFTVAAYALAAVLCAREAARSYDEERGRFLFWIAVGSMMFLLGINKQLDLQTWFTLTARKMARSEGWYEKRRAVQFVFIVSIALAGAGAFALVWRLVHDVGRDLWLPLLGVFLVICFVVIRAASVHHVDEFLHTRLAGFKMNWLLELGGIGTIIAGALRRSALEDENDRGPELQDA